MHFSNRFFIFKKIFTGVLLFYRVVLVSAVQQSESAIHLHISPFLVLKEHSFSKRETLDGEAVLNLDCSGSYVCAKIA